LQSTKKEESSDFQFVREKIQHFITKGRDGMASQKSTIGVKLHNFLQIGSETFPWVASDFVFLTPLLTWISRSFAKTKKYSQRQ
jgi:hypothetical protein